MRNLILLFIRSGGFLLFVLFEAISFYLVVRFNEDQKAIYVSSVSNVTSYMDESASEWIHFFKMDDYADSLADANALLIKKLAQAKAETRFLPAPNDTLPTIPEFGVLDAKVVTNSVNRSDNYMIINKGSRHGITEGMGVLTEKGVVGLVREVNTNYSLVMTLLHRQLRLSAAIQSNGYFGSLVWEGRDPYMGRLEHIPKHARPRFRDTVVSSGYSLIFPPDIKIGVVDTSWLDPTSNFHEIKVRYFEDLGSVQRVYVVWNKDRKEQNELLQAAANE
jgi:rod shape-determining protein MreC